MTNSNPSNVRKSDIGHARVNVDGSTPEPHIQWNHVDGPVLICHDGSMHWLTMWERMALKFGFITVKSLDKQYNMDDCRG